MRDERWVDRFWYAWSNSLFYEPVDVHYHPSSGSFIDLLDRQSKERTSREGIWWMVNYWTLDNFPK